MNEHITTLTRLVQNVLTELLRVRRSLEQESYLFQAFTTQKNSRFILEIFLFVATVYSILVSSVLCLCALHKKHRRPPPPPPSITKRSEKGTHDRRRRIARLTLLTIICAMVPCASTISPSTQPYL